MKSFNFFDEIKEILQRNPDVFAHIKPGKKPETLFQHTGLVKHYTEKLISVNNLESVIEKHIERISFGDNDISGWIRILFYHSIFFHDLGKFNDNFQAKKMLNEKFKFKPEIKIGSEHSFLSAYLFLYYFLDKIVNDKKLPKSSKAILFVYVFLFTVPILKHHSARIDKDYNFEDDKINSITQFSKIFNLELTHEQVKIFVDAEKTDKSQNLWEFFNETAKNKELDFFALFSLLKLNYSLLTAADYYATTAYMTGLKLDSHEDFGLITEKFKKQLPENIKNCKTYNSDLIENIQKYNGIETDSLKIKSNKNLNILRQKLGANVLVNIEKHKDDKVFYIEAPTGGGKTNMSMLAVVKLLELHQEINKIFYVFPFTTLITQTVKSIKETLGLSDRQIAQVHSKAGFQTRHNREEDAKYGTDLRNQIDNLFVNYPFTLLTHIKFFDILKSPGKKTNYLFHRLANSIVVIDELQSYNPAEWDKVKYFISQYSELFNIRFILMSATLPKIDEIEISGFQQQFKPYVSLIPDAKKYLRNPNFSQRVKIKTELLNRTFDKETGLKELAGIVLEKSKDYAQNRTDRYKGSIYTIIEFIFKKSASEFYDIIGGMNEFFNEIFVLSGTILEPRRKYIIEFLKDEANRSKNILLITTQVVEAGVDIDMDIGFKNQSLLDSDEQLAGRINRNVNKNNCELWLFRYNEPKTIYGRDLRYKITKAMTTDEINEILIEKNFEKLYKEVFKKKNKLNTSVYAENINDYFNAFKKLDFRAINDKFKLIDSDTLSVFVSINIPVVCYKTEKNFTNEELNFIKQNHCFADDSDSFVSGEKIWNLYVSLINNKDLPFSIKNIELLKLNGIISKFVFSVFVRKVEDLKPFLDNDDYFDNYIFGGYAKLNSENVYSLKSGLDEKELEKISNTSFEFI